MSARKKTAKKAQGKATAKKHAAKQRSWLGALFKPLLTLLVLAVFGLVYLDAWMLERFNSKKWSLPATVYARPLELYEGLGIDQADVIRELQATGFQERASAQPGSFQRYDDYLRVFTHDFAYWDGLQPAQSLSIRFGNGRIKSLQAGGAEVGIMRLEPVEIGRIHADKLEDRLLVSLDEVPPTLVDALLATEDRHFYQHHGISPRAIARAFWVNLQQGKVVEGGSTITQQLIKNFFLTNERSYWRKGLEAIMAVMLEWHASKQEILEAYINEVFVAQDGARAIHGFGLASQYLFGKPLKDLQLHQTALLVAMMKGPSYYNPLRHPERARERRDLVLKLLESQGRITAQQSLAARGRPLELIDGVSSRHVRAVYPAYLDLVRRQLRRDYSEDDLATQGLRIFTNLDPQWQWRAQDALQQGVQRLERGYGGATIGLEGAAVVVDHATGEVLAMVGGRNPRVAGFNRALDAQRPMGSLVKPAVYLTALEQGYNLQSRLSDAPFALPLAKGASWAPQNFDQVYHGDVPLYMALARSYNVAAARLTQELGVKNVAHTLERLGLEHEPPAVPALALGAVDLSAFDVAQMYATIAAKGFYAPLRSIREITDAEGNKLKRYPLRLEQRAGADVMYLLDYALQNVMHEGTGKSVQERFAHDTRIAGKTGTSNDQRDSWFAGYDASKLVVVWLGRDDNTPLPISGGTGALPVWADIMVANRSARGANVAPDNVHFYWVDKNTGKLSGERCENAVYMPYIDGTEPRELATCTVKTNSIIHWFKKWFQ